MTSARIWGSGAGAVVVLAATAVWAYGSTGVDAGLWADVRPVIEARLVAQSAGTGAGESEPALRSRWFCRAEALDLEESGDQVRAGINALCEEYGEHAGALVQCGGAQIPQVVRLERDDTANGGYRVVAQEEPPDGEGYGAWEDSHFSHAAQSRLDEELDSTGLRTAARSHFGLPADAPVKYC